MVVTALDVAFGVSSLVSVDIEILFVYRCGFVATLYLLAKV